MHSYTQSLVTKLAPSADAEKAVAMKAYMKNQFEFLGVPTSGRRKIFKDHLKENAITSEHQLAVIVKELWMLPEREFQYCAMETLAHYKKFWHQEIIELI